MCGFVGIYDSRNEGRVSADTGFRMRESLSHRGPDGVGAWSTPNVFFGHTRLSILDLSDQGLQPLFNEDKSVISIFNGEIYNYQEIRRDLQSRGHIFHGNSDAEIIPHLYEEMGDRFVDKIKGMFAIALFDANKKSLLLIRDRFGIKPLYYAELNGVWYFSSEIKAILRCPQFPRQIDEQAIHDYLSFSFVPDPATGFQSIRALKPRTFLKIEHGKSTEHRYWKLTPSKNQNLRVDETKEQLRDLLSKSISSQLISDVPVGAFLSGGIDSSLVTAFAAKSLKTPLPTFCVKFPDQEYDESAYARIVAEACKTKHTELFIPPHSADPALIEKLLLHFDQPYGDSSLIPTYLVSREMRSHVKVALSGDGGDEVFGGYEPFWQIPFIYNLKRVPAGIRRFSLKQLKDRSQFFSSNFVRRMSKVLNLSLQDPHQIFYSTHSYISEDEKKRLYSPDFLPDPLSSSRFFENLYDHSKVLDDEELYDFITDSLFEYSLPGDMLRKVDMMSMLAGLEVRVPLMDEDIVQFASTLPLSMKRKGRKGKIILRNLLSDYVPQKVVNKKKWGFGIPLDTCASREFHSYVHDTLLSSNGFVRGIIDERRLKKWVDDFRNSHIDSQLVSRQGLYQRIFMLLSLELWLSKTVRQPADGVVRESKLYNENVAVL